MPGRIGLPGGRGDVARLLTSRHDFGPLVLRLDVARRGQAEVNVSLLVAFILLLTLPLDARLDLLQLFSELLGLLLQGSLFGIIGVAILSLGGGLLGFDSALGREPGTTLGDPGSNLGRRFGA